MRAPRLLFLAIALALIPAASARADEPAPEPPPTPATAQLEPAAPATPSAVPLLPAQMTERKIPAAHRLPHRPSGFWMSNRPAQGGAYRYGKLSIGAILAAITGFLMWRLARRHSQAPRPAWPSRGDRGDGAG